MNRRSRQGHESQWDRNQSTIGPDRFRRLHGKVAEAGGRGLRDQAGIIAYQGPQPIQPKAGLLPAGQGGIGSSAVIWRFRPATALLLAGGLAGCVGLGDAPPTVTVQAVQLMAIGFPVERLAVILCVTNPNATALDFRHVSAKLDVAQDELLSGTTDSAVHLAAKSSTPVPFSVAATIETIGPQLLAVIKSGEILYRLHGTVSLAGFGGLTMPFSRSGRLDAVAIGRLLADRSDDFARGLGACATPP